MCHVFQSDIFYFFSRCVVSNMLSMRRKISPQRSIFIITNMCETLIYSWLYLVWLHMNICAWKEKKICTFIHHISVRTVHIHAVVQVYTELSKHLKNMKISIHFHLTKSRIHLIFSKTNTRMPPNRHSNICSSIWLAAPGERSRRTNTQPCHTEDER